MKLFGYGSLMDGESMKKSIPDGRILGTDALRGYRRKFDVKSPYRKNSQGTFSSVLTISPDASCTITGVLIELSEERHEELLRREEGYEQLTVELISGEKASTFIARNYNSYPYVFDDDIQAEYLKLCTNAADQYGFLDNFLDSTFIEEVSLRAFDLLE